MKKVERSYEIVKNRLQKYYHIPQIKIYSTVYTMLRGFARANGYSYKYIVDFYTKYINNPKEATYIKTKYEGRGNRAATAFTTRALSGDPIMIAYDNIRNDTEHELVFLILHEIGHNVCKPDSENQADKFAIRWTRKFIKEGLIKYKENK